MGSDDGVEGHEGKVIDLALSTAVAFARQLIPLREGFGAASSIGLHTTEVCGCAHAHTCTRSIPLDASKILRAHVGGLLALPLSVTNANESGYTLVELMIGVAVAATVAGATIPMVDDTLRHYALTQAAANVAATVREARLMAVSKNRTVRVRFDCPAPGQMRIVEVTGNPTIDTAVNRCSPDAYPYPDPDPNALPNADGPVVPLPSRAQFGTFESLEIDPQGRVTPQTNCPNCSNSPVPATIDVRNSYATRTITVTTGGQVVAP
jgi:prepilin-type N-terminal cleavage/methylation domain-containing protein